MQKPDSVTTWQPIKTMPNTPCIVTDGKIVSIYSNGFVPWNEGKSMVFMQKPTHWMPLPEPPNV